MADKAKPIPDRCHGAIPYLICGGAAKAMEFYKTAFGAVEVYRLEMGPGAIGHAEMTIGDALFMLADEYPDMGFKGPKLIGGTPVSMYIYVPDVDAFAKRAEAAGAIVKRPLETQFYGDRSVQFEDPFGHVWGFATHVEDVAPDEIKRRAHAKFGCG